MKKSFLLAGVLTCMMAFGIQAAYAQANNLDTAIQDVAADLAPRIGVGSSLAVVAMRGGTVHMSDYIINEMIRSFVRKGQFTVVDRLQLELTAQELDFSLSGEVSDATAQLIGRRIGAQVIVAGELDSLGTNYLFRARAIHTETGEILYVATSLVAGNDPVTMALLGTGTVIPGMAQRSFFSVGGGFLVDWGTFGRLRDVASGSSTSFSNFGAGAFGFVDATFVELALGFMRGRVNLNAFDMDMGLGQMNFSESFTAFTVSLLGKYPFEAGNAVSIFPALGIEYKAFISTGDGFGAPPSNKNTFRIKFGAGGDFNVNERVFVRAVVLGSYRRPPVFLRDVGNQFGQVVRTSGGIGVSARLGLGFRL